MLPRSWISVVALLATCAVLVVAGDSDGATVSCAYSAGSVRVWVICLMVVPSMLNLASIALLIFSIILVRRLKSVVEAISSSTHWLTRTAIRVGLGPTAKKALIEYAKGKPELKKLLGEK
uniref:Transmembrane protein n=1 Tax=Panagrellus redivivus TaxID=6233 RepID=A0A7E4VNL2_PANRE